MSKNYNLAYLLIRLAIGVSMFGHGLVRLPKLSGFVSHIVGNFKDSMIPGFLTTPFAYSIPIIEFVVGVLLILGFFTKQALVVGCVLMIALVFGSTMIENWSIIDSQLIHALVFSGLLITINYNYLALDNNLKKIIK
ncbi:DoxX family protein [Cellulophaga baltica]|uniref:DoxX family protein n=1 Tax=Cellulophaga TaxID=104264 RepID=UPI001C071025|nr:MULTISPECIES: DoxX family protein [Cellulophaga]MBU2997179.1 DoxX family protein [Cellulophaga baltica]MDO6768577.1 DoxX family protein [Cellulophaga sp. 1_MG-2023]